MPTASLVHSTELEHAGGRDSHRPENTAIISLMTELDASSGHTTEDHGASTFSLVRRQLPFLAILALAIGGVAYTNFSQRPLVGYWELLAIAMGVVCVVTQWSELEDKQARFRLMWTQALHWLAVLVTMNIMLFSGVQQLLPTLATSLVLLILLALGTFLAGVHLRVASNRLSRPCIGAGGSGDLVGQAIGTVLDSGRGFPGRARHGVLVLLGRYASGGPLGAGRPHFPIRQKAVVGRSRNDQGREMVMKRLIAAGGRGDGGCMRGVRRRRETRRFHSSACPRMVTKTPSGTMSVPRPWGDTSARDCQPAKVAWSPQPTAAARIIRGREGRASEIFGCAGNNRNPTDR